jgi:flagellar basal-body rod protein FlgC
MDMNILNTAASGLAVQRLKMDTIAGNLANINTTRDAEGNVNAYRRKIVNFETILDAQNQVDGVTVKQIEEDDSPLKAVYEPGHPDADEKGYVYYPNVSSEKEMVEMMNAKNAYEANIKTVQVFKSMFNSALEI